MKKMIKAAIAALGVAGAAMSGAAAQSDSTVVAGFDEQTLGAILTAGGVQWRVVDRGEDGSAVSGSSHLFGQSSYLCGVR